MENHQFIRKITPFPKENRGSMVENHLFLKGKPWIYWDVRLSLVTFTMILSGLPTLEDCLRGLRYSCKPNTSKYGEKSCGEVTISMIRRSILSQRYNLRGITFASDRSLHRRSQLPIPSFGRQLCLVTVEHWIPKLFQGLVFVGKR